MGQIYRDTVVAKEMRVGDRVSYKSALSINESDEVVLDVDKVTINEKDVLQVAGDKVIVSADTVLVPEDTPANAVASSVTLAAADLALMAVGDTVEFDGNTFTMVAANPEATEFTDTAGLIALIDALEDWNAAESTGAIVITAAVKGVAFDGEIATVETVAATTENGEVAVKAAATLGAADIARMAAGDEVVFDGNTFTKVASDAGAGEFTNTAGLAALFDALDDWAAAVDGSDIDITAAEVGADANDVDVVVNLYRVTAGGVDGTPGLKGMFVFDSTHLWMCTADSTVEESHWKSAALA